MSVLDSIIEDYYDDEILKADGFDDEEDAIEHLSFNTMGAYVGEKTPIWCMDNYE